MNFNKQMKQYNVLTPLFAAKAKELGSTPPPRRIMHTKNKTIPGLKRIVSKGNHQSDRFESKYYIQQFQWNIIKTMYPGNPEAAAINYILTNIVKQGWPDGNRLMMTNCKYAKGVGDHNDTVYWCSEFAGAEQDKGLSTYCYRKGYRKENLRKKNKLLKGGIRKMTPEQAVHNLSIFG